MKWEDIGNTSCPIARSLSVVGERWTILILRNAFMGAKRFEAFQQSLGISRHRLSDRLGKLVKLGVMKKVPYQDHPARYECRLTEMGRDWYQVQLAIVAWGNKWLADEAGPALWLRHKQCGEIFTPTLACSECGEKVAARDVEPVPGPGLSSNDVGRGNGSVRGVPTRPTDAAGGAR